VHLGKTIPGDFANDLRRRPRIRSYLADSSSFAARAICVISPRAEYKPGQTWSPNLKPSFPGSFPHGVGTIAFYQVAKPGEFRVKFTYNSPKIDDPLAKDIWIGELMSNEVVIRIKAEANEKK
jgi:hypothetical protein